MDGDVQTAEMSLAALSAEVLLRDEASSRHDALRERYEVARLTQERKRLAMDLHEKTHSALQRLVAAVREAQHASESTGLLLPVPRTVVAAVQLLLSSMRRDTTDEKLQKMLTPYAHATRRDASSSLSSFISGEGSSAMSLRLGPLLYWSTVCGSYASVLLQARRLQASELARLRCQLTLLRSANTEGECVAIAYDQQAALDDACRGLTRAKDLQRSVKRRLYQTHQRLTTRRPDQHSDTTDHLDPEAAAELCAQVRRELRKGRVTLLRILCEDESLPQL